MKTVIYYKYGTIYREVIHTPMMNWCQLMNQQTQNAIVKNVIDVMRECFPEGVHECPYTVRFSS